MIKKDVFTTHEAAGYCKVSPMSITRWIKDGKIEAYKTPGGHRRISLEVLQDFMIKNKMPFPETFQRRKPKILVVDDEHMIRKTLFKYFSNPMFNYEVDVAVDGFEAGKKILSFQPDILLLDIKMPGIDGFKVCQDMKTNPDTKDIIIIILSGHINEDDESFGLRLGADSVMRKPITYDLLEVEIASLLKKKKKY